MIRKYLLSMTDEGLVSLLNFLVNIALIRAWSPHEYGVFALWWVAAQMLVTVQNALVSSPLSVFRPVQPRMALKRRIEVLLYSVNSLFLVAVTLVSVFAALFAHGVDLGLGTAAAIGAFVGGTLLRSYVRAFCFARLKPAVSIAVDLVYFAVTTLLFVVLWLAPDMVDLGFAFALLAVANVAGSVVGLVVLRERLAPALGVGTLRGYAAVWQEARWALLGVTLLALQSRGHAILVPALVGTAAFATLNAGQILFGPIRTLMNAWGMLSRPHLATVIGRGDRARFMLLNVLSLLSICVGLGLLFGAIALFWPWINEAVYAGKYEDMHRVVLLWGAVTVLLAVSDVFDVALQSLREFRRLAYARAIGAAVSMTSVTLLLLTAPFEYSLLGLALGEAAATVYRVRVYVRVFLRLPSPGRTAAQPA